MSNPKLALIFALVIVSCSPTRNKENAISDEPKTPIGETAMLGERTNGSTIVYDHINGQPVFKLDDDVLVACSGLKNDWFEIQILADITPEEYDTLEKFDKGRKLMYGEQAIGEALMELEAYGGTNNKEAWIRLGGFVQKSSIKPESIVESVLETLVNKASTGRVLDNYEAFVIDFGLDSTDQFNPFKVFYNYESGIDDPSPLYRIGLVFLEGKLVAIIHSRPIEVNGASNTKLERAFDCLIFDDVRNKKEIVDAFNGFLRAVD